MISYIRHDEEFYFIAKLVSGEEIVGQGFAVEEDGLTQIFITEPVEIQVITKSSNNSVVKGVSMNKWMQFSDEDFFILNEKDIISIGGLSDEMIHMYNLFIKKASSNQTVEDAIEEHEVELDNEMGYVSSVSEARKRLEQIYNKS
jgi:hypothetical protein